MTAISMMCVLVMVAVWVVASQKIHTDQDVLILTKNNFKDAVAANKFLLVKFYAPGCGHCRALAPKYAEAAKTLADQNSPIKLAKVDGNAEIQLADEHRVAGYPTLKFFMNGNAIDYNGGRQADDIVAWLLKTVEYLKPNRPN